MRSAQPLLALLLAALPLAPVLAQDQVTPPPLPRVIYGAPEPSVIYGPSSAEPARRAPAAPPPAVPASPAPSQGSLTYGSGPLYFPPPGYWGPPPPHWDRRPARPLPPASVPGASGGYYEPPQPPGTYIGRPPSAPEPRWGFERPRR